MPRATTSDTDCFNARSFDWPESATDLGWSVTPAPTRDISPASTLEVSIVCPAYNEEAGLLALTERVTRVLEAEQLTSYELLIVDDGSRDDTWETIATLARRYPHVRGLRLARNFGHQRALLAGLAHARGKAVVSMDADLQHPPESIPAMLAEWRNGTQVVLTRRRDAAVTSLFKRTTSRWFYGAFSTLCGVRLNAGTSDFRLLDASVVAEVLRFRNPDLFLRGTVQWLGFASTAIDFDVHPRFAGTTSYTFSRMLRFAAGSIVSFSNLPLQLAIWLALVTGGAAIAEVAYVLNQYAHGHTTPGWASLAALIALLFAVQFAVLGILGMYLGRVHEMLQNRPPYVVQTYT